MGKERHYVKNKDLLAEILKCRKNDVTSNELGEMILRIATNYSNKGIWWYQFIYSGY